MTVKPDSRAARAFLRRWAPEGPWVLTAIQVDRKSIVTRTFTPADEQDLDAYLKEHNGVRNIYFHVNPPTKPLRKKAEREDIKSVDWLHVDIDPRPREDIVAEQARALGLLTDNLPKGVPAPTCVIFSGGGYQGFWRLEEPILIDGDLERAEDAKRYNQQLEVLFGGDNCHNIDRIMRLPGTVNIPDARKAKKGREPALARVVEFNDNVYTIGSFTKAPEVQLPGTGLATTGRAVKLDSEVEYFDDVNELDKYHISDRLKVVIVQGRHPDERKEGDDSRSAWLFDAVCNLVRAGVPDEVVYSVITNPEFGISDSVLELGQNAERYALRQIARAREEAEEPWLRRLNDEYAVIEDIGGHCMVVHEMMDMALGRSRLSRMSFDAFRNAYMNRRIQIGVKEDGTPVMTTVGKYWLSHPDRRQYRSIVFAPGRDVDGSYNLWRGYACQSIPGECSLYVDHVRNNICNGDEELFNYLIRWMARMIQRPDTTGEVAVVLQGGRGTGKSVFATELGALLGRHFLHISNSSHLVGNFNAHLRDSILLFADEAFYAGDKKHTSILKTLITEKTLAIEAKGVDVEMSPNYIHLIMASNDLHVIPAGGDERRFLVLEVGEGHKQDKAYFGELLRQMESGGREALLHYLMELDISDFQVRDVPVTDALRSQKLQSLGFEEEWWFQKLLDGRLFQTGGWPELVPKRDLLDDYLTQTRRFNQQRRATETALGMFLRHVMPRVATARPLVTRDFNDDQGFTRTVKRREPAYRLPSLVECREHWERLHGPTDWDDDEQLDLEVERHDTPIDEVPF